MRPAIAVLLCALTLSAQQPQTQPAQQQPVVEAGVFVTAIDIVADVRDAAGKVPAGLTPADFVLLENGIERKVIGVDYLNVDPLAQAADGSAAPAARPNAKPWQTVLYFETDLSNGRGRRQTAKEMAKQAEKLVALGTVDVVFANPVPKPLLQNSRDAAAVRAALQTIEKSGGANQLALHRQEFMSFVQSTTQVQALRATDDERLVMNPTTGQIVREKSAMPQKSSMSANVTAVDVKQVRPYIEQEVQLITRFRKHLTAWMSNYNRYAPRTLIMVTDGYDLDPLEYYSAHLNKGDDMELRSYVSQAGLASSADKLATTLATAGWMTLSVQGDSFMDGWMDDAASMTGVGRVHKNIQAQPQTGPRSIFYRPMDPLLKVAEETGGDVVANSGKIAAAIDRIDDRLRITYQVDRKPDGKALQISLKARDPKLKVRSARWTASATPDEMAEHRALSQLQEGAFTGDLPVEATVEWTTNTARKQGTMRVKSTIPGGAAKADFRFTLAILVPPGEAFVTNRPLAGYRLQDGGVFNLRTPLDLPPATSIVVVAIEETSTGMWGSARIEVK